MTTICEQSINQRRTQKNGAAKQPELFLAQTLPMRWAIQMSTWKQPQGDWKA